MKRKGLRSPRKNIRSSEEIDPEIRRRLIETDKGKVIANVLQKNKKAKAGKVQEMEGR